jgi:hypothetical protein
MPSPDAPLSDDTKRSLDAAELIAQAVDRAVVAVVPDIVDIQVSAAPSGVAILSGTVFSEEAARRADAAARAVPGVRQFISSLTVVT